MNNILFITTFKVSSTKGGTEKTTITVASELKSTYSYNCYSAYFIDEKSRKEECFDDEFLIRYDCFENDISQIVLDKNIDVIIIQGEFEFAPKIRKLFPTIKIIFAHHFEPGWEENFITRRGLLLNIVRRKSFKTIVGNILKILVFPYYHYEQCSELHAKYRCAYEKSDRVVLLVNEYIEDYVKYGNISGRDKFRIIPNGLSFDFSLPEEKIYNKKHKALIVSRLEERQKRVFTALDIWNSIDFKSDWKLFIVGDGPDKKRYEKYVENHKIAGVVFTGRKNPLSEYKESAVFIMTSQSEGWGITLTEAQQMGVVPIAFDTCAPIHEIIRDGENGKLVNEGKVDEYSAELEKLMHNSDYRIKLAKNAIISTARYSKKSVGKMWNDVICELTSK